MHEYDTQILPTVLILATARRFYTHRPLLIWRFNQDLININKCVQESYF